MASQPSRAALPGFDGFEATLQAPISEVAAQLLLHCFTDTDGRPRHVVPKLPTLHDAKLVKQLGILGRFEHHLTFLADRAYQQQAWSVARECTHLWHMALLVTDAGEHGGLLLLRRGVAVVTCDQPLDEARRRLSAVAPAD